MISPILNYRLTAHAKEEMARRHISEEDVARVLSNPEQIESIHENRKVYQSRIVSDKLSATYLFRVFVDIDRQPPEVVTVYRTSKLSKYWKADQ